jgi:23S rRNA U2552 (ribose-2'-O)-methylase RlmE/FtsJ
MVTKTATMALTNITAQLLLVQGISFCAHRENQEEDLGALPVHHSVMARRTARIQQMRKRHVVSVQISFMVKQSVIHIHHIVMLLPFIKESKEIVTRIQGNTVLIVMQKNGLSSIT